MLDQMPEVLHSNERQEEKSKQPPAAFFLHQESNHGPQCPATGSAYLDHCDSCDSKMKMESFFVQIT